MLQKQFDADDISENTQKLKEELNPLWTNAKRGRPLIHLEEGLYITLWALANKNSYREIGDRFNKSISTVFDILIKTCKKIVELLPKFVKWPSSNEAIDSIVSKFNYLRGPNSFPNVVGAIDSTHIKIPSPSEDGSSYYNRKGFASMVLQATCDSDRAFTNIFFGWPGRCHDAYVFKESELGKKLINGTLKLPPDIHLIGDSAYPLSTYLLVPYKDNGSLSEMQKQFNYRLSSSRVIIEQAFGTLKAKFRILESLNFKKIENIRYIVLACVVLHNFIIFKGEPFSGSSQDRTESASHVMENLTATTSRTPLPAGRSKRDLLASLLYA